MKRRNKYNSSSHYSETNSAITAGVDIVFGLGKIVIAFWVFFFIMAVVAMLVSIFR